MDNNESRNSGIENIEFARAGGMATGAAEAAAGRKKGFTLKKGIIIIVILAVIFAGVGIIAAAIQGNSSQPEYGQDGPYVGVLKITGEINGDNDQTSPYQHDWVMAQVKKMKNDPDNKGIMLYIDSPGGSVFQSDELYNALENYKKKTKRPLYAYFDETAASGAYYISADADKIIANKLCTTGSIGVYMGPVIDSSGLLYKLGVGVDFIKSGPNKAMGNPFQPLTAEQRQIYQSQIDEYYLRFADIVSKGRDIPIDTVYTIGDGRTYTATQAVQNGLVDEVGTYTDAKKLMKKDAGTSNFEKVEYIPEQTLRDVLWGMEESMKEYADSQSKSDIEKTMDYISENSSHAFYYEAFDLADKD